jgi:hypothetical protein
VRKPCRGSRCHRHVWFQTARRRGQSSAAHSEILHRRHLQSCRVLSPSRVAPGKPAALAELERGEPFAELAGRHSDCKDKGGDLGQFPAGYMVQEFEDAIRTLEPGGRTGIFTTPLGFHIAELRARTSAAPASFDDVRADIERVMTMMNEHQVYLRAVAELRSRADIRRPPLSCAMYTISAARRWGAHPRQLAY